MSRVFFTADQHYFHSNIIQMCNRPFEGVAEMHNIMEMCWNSVVGKDDMVFVVGDFALTNNKRQLSMITQSLNGHKYLIRGNHDHFSNNTYRWAGFEDVYDHPILYNNFFIISHEPQFVSESAPYANIFGHVHDSPMYRDVSSRSFCVCVERNGYAPVDFIDIKRHIAAMGKS